MEKGEHKEKILQLLEDTSAYKKLQRDPTSTIERRSNDSVRVMLERKYVDEPLHKHLTRYDGVVPKFYGLPKAHKNNTPLRPIASFVKAPTHSISQFLAKILRNIRDDTLNVRSAQDLQNMLDIQINSEYI